MRCQRPRSYIDLWWSYFVAIRIRPLCCFKERRLNDYQISNTQLGKNLFFSVQFISKRYLSKNIAIHCWCWSKSRTQVARRRPAPPARHLCEHLLHKSLAKCIEIQIQINCTYKYNRSRRPALEGHVWGPWVQKSWAKCIVIHSQLNPHSRL